MLWLAYALWVTWNEGEFEAGSFRATAPGIPIKISHQLRKLPAAFLHGHWQFNVQRLRGIIGGWPQQNPVYLLHNEPGLAPQYASVSKKAFLSYRVSCLQHVLKWQKRVVTSQNLLQPKPKAFTKAVFAIGMHDNGSLKALILVISQLF